MNKQRVYKDGELVSRGIEWTDFTSNPARGCMHNCQWTMPDGTVAICYAETAANKFTKAYPEGFEHYYWRPDEFKKWHGIPPGSKVFVGSMADIYGHWVPDEHIREIYYQMKKRSDVIFQTLTKNPRRLARFAWELPSNCWAGISTPPDHMWQHDLSGRQRDKLFRETIQTLNLLRQHGIIGWLSAEPYTFDAVDYLQEYDEVPLDWIVIGAASNGPKYYAPDENLVKRLVMYCDMNKVPIFYKGNLSTLKFARDNWREEFPA